MINIIYISKNPKKINCAAVAAQMKKNYDNAVKLIYIYEFY